MNLADQNPRQATRSPWQSRTEFLIDESLATWMAPDEAIRAMVPAARRDVDPFPARTGFAKEEWTIEAVLNIDRYAPTNHSWISGVPAQKSYLNDDGSQASSRYSMGAMW